MVPGISEVLTADHRHGDELLAAAVQAAAGGDWAGCREQFDAFCESLKHHMTIEEQVLFPEFEQATGISGGPTRVMRYEHQKMLELLDKVSGVITAHEESGFRGAAESFAALMSQHSAKEEGILYPMCEQALPELDGEKLAQMLRPSST